MNNQFKETRIFFYNLIPYDANKPLSYDDWMKLPDSYKSAALYLRFYDQITLAWEKTKSLYTPTSDGVSILLQYLEKNVRLIAADEKRYSPRYIYKIAFNALYCECHDRVSTARAFKHEVSEQSMLKNSEGDAISYFDVFSADCKTLEMQISDSRKDELRMLFWEIVEKIGIEDYCILQKIIGTDPQVIMEDIKQMEGYRDYCISYQETHEGKQFKLPRLTENRKQITLSKLKKIFESNKDFYNISSDAVIY